MNEQEWLTQVEKNKDKLLSLIENYHPSVKRIKLEPFLPITALAAEGACELIRKDIARSFEGSPVEIFKFALEQKDWKRINNLLNDTWFGVPESASCWNITGFSEAVELMEDTPSVEY